MIVHMLTTIWRACMSYLKLHAISCKVNASLKANGNQKLKLRAVSLTYLTLIPWMQGIKGTQCALVFGHWHSLAVGTKVFVMDVS